MAHHEIKSFYQKCNYLTNPKINLSKVRKPAVIMKKEIRSLVYYNYKFIDNVSSNSKLRFTSDKEYSFQKKVYPYKKDV